MILPRRSVILTAILVCLVIYGIHVFSTLIGLLFETGNRDFITPEELDRNLQWANATKKGWKGPAGGIKLEGDQPQQLIPKIIHQTYKNTTIPEKWKKPWGQCQEMNDDYTYYLWTDETGRQFIAEHYPEFLPTFDAYPYTIQRADVIRYFVLAHYGGHYIDMDLGCLLPITALSPYPMWAHLTAPTGISNDGMGSIPNHPFWTELVLPNLPTHSYHFPLPYVTVMASTGPLYLSAMWKIWIDSAGNVDAGRIRVISRAEFSGPERGFFHVYKGSSWHGGDVRVFHWIAVNAVLVGFVAALACGVGLWACWGCWRGVLGERIRRRRWREGKNYELLERREV